MAGFGPEPLAIICPSCKQNVTTVILPIASTKTHIFAILLAMACLLPCAFAIYCTQCMRDAQHYCPSCATLVGIYER